MPLRAAYSIASPLLVARAAARVTALPAGTHEGVFAKWRIARALRSRRPGEPAGAPYLGSILVLDPTVARELCEVGFGTKEDLLAWVRESVRVLAGRWWDNFTTRNLVRELADLGEEPWATYAKASEDELIPVFEPDNVHVVVVGAPRTGNGARSTGASWIRASRATPPIPPPPPSTPGD